jgi:hypothetical protein
MTRRAITATLAGLAATAVAACATASPGATRASVEVSLAPDRAHAGRWCATAVDAREPDARVGLCQSPGRLHTEAVLRVDCPTHRVLLVGVAPRRLRAVNATSGDSSKRATLAYREHATAFAAAMTLSDFPARLRTTAGSRARIRRLRDPHSLCRSEPRGTGLIDAFDAP